MNILDVYVIGVLVAVVGVPIVLSIKWKCLFGFHQMYYAGDRHGMVFNRDQQGIEATSRPVMRCHVCGKSD